MNALQSVSVLPNGRALATVHGRARRFKSIEALAAWLYPDPEPDVASDVDVTDRSLPEHVATQFQEGALAV